MVVDAVLRLVALPDHSQRDAIYLISGRHRAVVTPSPAGAVHATFVEAVEPSPFLAASRFKGFKHASERVLIRRKSPKETQKSFFTWAGPKVEGRLGAARDRQAGDHRIERVVRRVEPRLRCHNSQSFKQRGIRRHILRSGHAEAEHGRHDNPKSRRQQMTFVNASRAIVAKRSHGVSLLEQPCKTAKGASM